MDSGCPACSSSRRARGRRPFRRVRVQRATDLLNQITDDTLVRELAIDHLDELPVDLATEAFIAEEPLGEIGQLRFGHLLSVGRHPDDPATGHGDSDGTVNGWRKTPEYGCNAFIQTSR